MSEVPSPPGPEDDARPRRRVRWPWLPLLFAVAAVIAVVVIRQLDITRDYRFVFIVMSVGVCLLGIMIWWLTCGPFALRYRLLLLAATVGAFVAAAVTTRVEFDGDSVPIRVSFFWTKTHDQRLDVPDVAGPPIGWEPTPHDFPRFLGPQGNGLIDNVGLATDWKDNPPREKWRHEIGGGWSGFVIVGEYAITQEQRGEAELVVCYRLADGEVVWSHQDQQRFDPATAPGNLGGWGPRATPTVHDGKVFTLGATGVFNCLDAATGERLWSHDTLAEFNVENLMWGRSCSPLIVDDNVVISVGAPGGKSLIAFDIESGDVAFHGGDRTASYASPILATLCGIRQIVVTNENFVTGHDAATGDVLWEHPWPGNSDSDATNTNPVAVGDNRLLLAKGYGVGCELIEIVDRDGKLEATSLWGPKPVMKTKLTNPIVRDGYVYGLDGGILQCIELESGKRKWKEGRVGHGQVLLVGDVLLVTYEKTGEVALVAASPEGYQELARFQALARAKTWNYPALAGRSLLVRNHEEVACFELPLAK